MILSSAMFLNRNEYTIMANTATTSSTEVKTIRNSIRFTCSLLWCKSSNSYSHNQFFVLKRNWKVWKKAT